MKTVLLIDDARAVRSLYAELIRQAGFEAETASSAEEGLHYIVEHGTPDLIITDISMPGVGGLEMCARLRKINNDVPILILSALSDKNLVAQAREHNVCGWLLKPVEPEYFLKKLHVLLGEPQIQALSS